MNVKSVESGEFREADNMFNLKKRIAIGFHPMIDRLQARAPLRSPYLAPPLIRCCEAP
jgi:hypothetical protein